MSMYSHTYAPARTQGRAIILRSERHVRDNSKKYATENVEIWYIGYPRGVVRRHVKIQDGCHTFYTVSCFQICPMAISNHLKMHAMPKKKKLSFFGPPPPQKD
jgi:hypothetical protein